MLPDKIMQSDMLDILFENRNKIYGAYSLRKEYNMRLYRAVSITIGIVLIFVLFTQIRHSEKISSSPFIIPDPKDLVTISLQPDKPEPPKATAAKYHKPQAQADPRNVIIVPDDVRDINPIVAIKDLTDKQVGDIDIAGDPVDGNAVNVFSANGNGNKIAGTPASALAPEVPVILEHSEIMPQYPGGNEAFQKFMLRNLAQPDNLQPGEKVTILVKFIVNKDGIISGAEIINSGRKDLDKEVLRVINKMQVWIPGRQNGQPVAVYFKLPVTFIGQE